MRTLVVLASLSLLGCEKAESSTEGRAVDPLIKANAAVVQLLRAGDTRVCGDNTAKHAAVSALVQNAPFTAMTRYLKLVSARKQIMLNAAYATDVRKPLAEVSCRAKMLLNDQQYDFSYTLRPSAENPNDYIVDASIIGLDKQEFGKAVSAEVTRQMLNPD
jgi:hypothetical protein